MIPEPMTIDSSIAVPRHSAAMRRCAIIRRSARNRRTPSPDRGHPGSQRRKSSEPAWPEYRRALRALQDYLVIAHDGEGDPIPRTKEDLYPNNTYSGVMQLAAKLRRTGDLADILPESSTVFFYPSGGSTRLTFEKNAEGKVTGILYRDDRHEEHWERN